MCSKQSQPVHNELYSPQRTSKHQTNGATVFASENGSHGLLSPITENQHLPCALSPRCGELVDRDDKRPVAVVAAALTTGANVTPTAKCPVSTHEDGWNGVKGRGYVLFR